MHSSDVNISRLSGRYLQYGFFHLNETDLENLEEKNWEPVEMQIIPKDKDNVRITKLDVYWLRIHENINKNFYYSRYWDFGASDSVNILLRGKNIFTALQRFGEN